MAGPTGRAVAAAYVLASLDQSLRRMGVDYVDIFYSHRFDPTTPLEETMGALDTAVRQGKALYAGISLLRPRPHPRGRAHPDRAGHAAADPPAVVLDAQPLDRGGAARRAGGDTGVGCIAFSPLAQGMLTNKYLGGDPGGLAGVPGVSRCRTDLLTDKNLEHVRALNAMAEERGQTLAQMALAWALRDERVTSVIVGASSVAQLDDNLGALDTLHFDDAELTRIDEHAVDAGINLWARSGEA